MQLTTSAMNLNPFINWKHQQLRTTQKRRKFIMFSAAAGKRAMSPDSGTEDHKTADGGETHNAIPPEELDTVKVKGPAKNKRTKSKANPKSNRPQVVEEV